MWFLGTVMKYKVYIVGAGCGDPELLTMKAHRLLQEADIVVYDRLISQEILDLIPRRVEMVYAGKSCRKHNMTQAEINEELVRYVKTGRKVVRLKGGDPFIFGRGGEEVEHLARNNIKFEVVPGISAASGISACLGIPLTHRGLATGVRFITGHKQKGEKINHDWKILADANTTLVIYMGLANLEEITDNLVTVGMDKSTPAVAVQGGTTQAEQVCFSTLSEIASAVKSQNLIPPTIIFIGKVVGFSSYSPETQGN